MNVENDKGEKAVRFFSRLLTHTKGEYARRPFVPARWEEKIVRDLFGTLRPDGLRQYRVAFIEIPKKNGKTELGAGIALTCLELDQEEGCEVYSAAMSRDQASICHRVAAQMVRNNPYLAKRYRSIRSTKIIYRREDQECFYKAISADADTNDGINAHCVIFDELHRQKNRELYDVAYRGMSTRSQPLLVMLSTAGIVGESELCWDIHEYARMVLDGIIEDSSFYAVFYGLEQEEDWRLEGKPARYSRRGICLSPPTGWYKANPALGDYLKVEALRVECEKAKRVPAEENSFRRFRVNHWVSQECRWINLPEWDACGQPFQLEQLQGKKCFGGLDLSSSQDLTAFVKVFELEDLFYLVPRFWIPLERIQHLFEQGDQRFHIWHQQGLLEATEGNQIDLRVIREAIKEEKFDYHFLEIAFDPWNATEIVQDLTDDGFTMVPMRQGFATMSPASKQFQTLLLAQRLRHGGHPILRWMMDCTSIKKDVADNIKPVKPDRLKSKKRIDGIVASIMALDRATRNPRKKESRYGSKDLRSV